jgi:hypothetical protein
MGNTVQARDAFLIAIPLGHGRLFDRGSTGPTGSLVAELDDGGVHGSPR